ncbi:unnamed protein product [Phytophthora lilii]|uniref:Unnamed protein product n=1 Tax=Phytophthora lilii TaxID=2077276 RepID=A0A9W7CPK0_9STRA|nr:unnamed protein product [Phytophthora lilii]
MSEDDFDVGQVEESLMGCPNEQAGRRVYFEHEAPSIHFHPFTKDEYDAGLKQADAERTSGTSLMSLVGTFIGWKPRNLPNDNSIMTRVRLTKRVHCPLDVLLMASFKKTKDLIPTIITPSAGVFTSAIMSAPNCCKRFIPTRLSSRSTSLGQKTIFATCILFAAPDGCCLMAGGSRR